MSTKDNVIVVGGGLAGLTAATILARSGKNVTVYEKSAELGGRARTQELGGFHFNMGAHAVYGKGDAARTLKQLGIRYTGRKPSAEGVALYKGRVDKLPTGPLSFFTSKLLDRGGKIELAGLMVRLMRLKPADFDRVTLDQWLDSTVKRPEVRDAMLVLARTATYTNAPEYVSASAAITQLQLFLKAGVTYVDGGWQTLVDGLRSAAESAGARIVTGSRVEGIDTGRGTHAVRLADGTVREASAVILAVEPRVASHLVDGGTNETLRSWEREAIPVRAACLDLGLSRLPSPSTAYALSVDSPLYMNAHSSYARLAPDGKVLFHVLKYLHPDEKLDAAANEREMEALLDTMQPGWRELVVERRYLPDMTVVNGMVAAERGGLAGRPGPQVPGIPGLYVAGDWVGPQGCLTDAVTYSARTAAEMVLTGAPESRSRVYLNRSKPVTQGYEAGLSK